METRAPWFVIGIVLGSTLLLPAMIADDGNSWEQDERRLSFTQTADGFRYESVRDTDSGNDEIQGSFSATNRRYTLTYYDREAANMTPLRLTVDFEALVEYQDLDGDQSFGLGDRIVQRLRVVDLGAPTATVEPVGDGGHRAVYEYPLTTLGPNEEATLALQFSVFPRTQIIGDEDVPPTRTHTELRIQNFPFENVTSRLAIETRVGANMLLQETSNGFFVSSDERRLVYEWPGQSWVDGDERPVHVTLLGTSGQNTGAGSPAPAVVLHSYDRGQDLSYQPIIGAEREEPAQQNVIVEFLTHGDWRLYGIGMVAAFALIGFTVWRRTARN